jgi:hypothetical protein
MNTYATSLQHRQNGAGRGRRAFTLLEMVLAVMVGSMVVVLSIALLTSIERGSSMMGARTEQTAEMQTARLVLNRALNSILAAPPVQNQGRAPAVARAEGEAPAPVERSTAPRVLLDVDPQATGVMERRDPDGTVVVQQPQRLEIVLLDSPVPSSSNVDPFALARVAKREANKKKRQSESDAAANTETGRGDGELTNPDDPTADEDTEDAAADETDPDAAGEGQSVEDGDLGVRAVRGVFELREQLLTAAQRERLRESARDKAVYELWWRPVASPTSVAEWTAMSRGERIVEAARLGRPVRLAGDITFARWRMFDDREKRTQYEATQYNQLPAYAEFEVETTAGLRHQWLFEIGWAIGPETTAEREASRSNANPSAPRNPGENDAAATGGNARVAPGNGATETTGTGGGVK